MKSRTVVVLGANGRLGSCAVHAFANAGWQVIAQARRMPLGFPPSVRVLDIPLTDTVALARVAGNARAVVHAINPPYAQWQSSALPLAQLGMDLATWIGATFMFPGNVYNFGTSMPERLREDTPQHPTTRKGHVRHAIEQAIAARSSDVHVPMRSVLIRAGDFFGSGRGSWFDLVIVKSLAAGRLIYPGPLDQPHAWAYLPDLARAFVAAADRHDLPRQCTLHFPGHTLTGKHLLDGLERAARSIGAMPSDGVLKRGGMPWRLIRAGGLFVPAWREIAEMEYLWRQPHCLDADHIAEVLGPLPSTTLDDALRAALLELGFGSA